MPFRSFGARSGRGLGREQAGRRRLRRPNAYPSFAERAGSGGPGRRGSGRRGGRSEEKEEGRGREGRRGRKGIKRGQMEMGGRLMDGQVDGIGVGGRKEE